MTCDHVHVDGQCVTICRPREVYVLREVDAGDRWCFGCRKRLPHVDRLLHDNPHPLPPDFPPDELSYYDPWWSRECSGCGEDRTVFPQGGW